MRFPQVPSLRITQKIVWAIALTSYSSSRVEAQQRSVSATMLRVLAEAADVQRTGTPIYIVADYRYPHNTLPGFSARDSAVNAARALNADPAARFGVFGPYVTPRDPVDAAHQIMSISVTTTTASGTQTHRIDPRRVDALFFNLSAIEKFVLPYYSKNLGPGYASRLRDKSIEALNSGAFVRHCWSWGCFDPEPFHVVGPPVPRWPGSLAPTPGPGIPPPQGPTAPLDTTGSPSP